MLNNSKSRPGSFSKITFNNVIELFSKLGPNKQTIENLISSILTQQNDIGLVGKFINAAMQKNTLDIETVTLAINKYKQKLTNKEKEKILSEVSDEKIKNKIRKKIFDNQIDNHRISELNSEHEELNSEHEELNSKYENLHSEYEE